MIAPPIKSFSNSTLENFSRSIDSSFLFFGHSLYVLCNAANFNPSLPPAANATMG